MITGEPMPVAKGGGDKVTGATVNGNGFVGDPCRTGGRRHAAGADVHLVGEAQRTRAPIQKLAVSSRRYFVQSSWASLS